MLSNLRSLLAKSSSSSAGNETSPPRRQDGSSTSAFVSPQPSSPSTVPKSNKKTAVLSVSVALEEAFGQPTASLDQSLFAYHQNAGIKLAAPPPKRPPRPTTQLLSVHSDPNLLFIRAKSPPSSREQSPSPPVVVQQQQNLANPPSRRKSKTVVLQPTAVDYDVSPTRQRREQAKQETLGRMRDQETRRTVDAKSRREQQQLAFNDNLNMMVSGSSGGHLPRPPSRRNSPPLHEANNTTPELKVSRVRRPSELPPSSRMMQVPPPTRPAPSPREDVDEEFVLKRRSVPEIEIPRREKKKTTTVSENVAMFAPPLSEEEQQQQVLLKSPKSSPMRSRKKKVLQADAVAQEEGPILRLHRVRAGLNVPPPPEARSSSASSSSRSQSPPQSNAGPSPYQTMKKRMEMVQSRKNSLASAGDMSPSSSTFKHSKRDQIPQVPPVVSPVSSFAVDPVVSSSSPLPDEDISPSETFEKVSSSRPPPAALPSPAAETDGNKSSPAGETENGSKSSTAGETDGKKSSTAGETSPAGVAATKRFLDEVNKRATTETTSSPKPRIGVLRALPLPQQERLSPPAARVLASSPVTSKDRRVDRSSPIVSSPVQEEEEAILPALSPPRMMMKKPMPPSVPLPAPPSPSKRSSPSKRRPELKLNSSEGSSSPKRTSSISPQRRLPYLPPPPEKRFDQASPSKLAASVFKKNLQQHVQEEERTTTSLKEERPVAAAPASDVMVDTTSISTEKARAALNSLPGLPSPQTVQVKKQPVPPPPPQPAQTAPPAPQRSDSERRMADRVRRHLEHSPLKQPNEALAVCDEWKRLNPHSAECWMLVGRAYMLKGESSQAEHSLATALALAQEHPDLCKLVLRDVNRVKTMTSSRDKCLEELGRRGSTMALSHVSRAREISPCNPQLCVLKAAALLVSSSSMVNDPEETAGKKEDNSLVKKELDAGMELVKANSMASPNKDLVMTQIGRPACQYARVMHRAGLTSEADTLLEEVCSRTTASAVCKPCVDLLKLFRQMEAAKSDANEAYAQGKFGESLRLFTQALQLDGENALYNSIILSNRAASYMSLGDYQRAVDDCDQALRLVPSFLRARLRRARALQKMGKYRESIADFELAMRVAPSPAIANELAEARKALKDHQDKKRMFHTKGWGDLPKPPQPPPGGYARSSNRPATAAAAVEDLYKVLGIAPQASTADIKKAYHRAALKHHPDKNVGDSEASVRFKKVLEAFHTLSDPQARRRYDLTFSSISVPMM